MCDGAIVLLCMHVRERVFVCGCMRESVLFVGKCPVTRMTVILALASPLCAASSREAPLPILLVGLHADIVEQK